MLVIAIGLVASLLWCLAGWYYLERSIGFQNLMLLLPHEIGIFLLGFFGPLLLLWLVILLGRHLKKVRQLKAAQPVPAAGSATPKEPELETSPAAAREKARETTIDIPPKRPEPAEPSPQREERPLPPKRPADAAPPKAEPDPEAPATSLPGPLPPKRPQSEKVAPLPSSAGGTLPPKNPRSRVAGYATAQGHVLKELNAIAMDIALLICNPETYQAHCTDLERGKEDSFFSLVREILKSDPDGARRRLSDSGNLDLLESYHAKFQTLLQAAENEPDGKALIDHLESSAAGRLDTTIERHL